jgi:SAM-dependent methyltransferase
VSLDSSRADRVAGGLAHGSDPRLSTFPMVSQCPRCRAAVRSDLEGWRCDRCMWKSTVVAGVPILLSDPGSAEHDELDHGHGHKESQRTHFDRLGEEAFEIDRPHGTPRLYEFLLTEKFLRGAGTLGERIRGTTALTVCGGSGMDAEYLSRAGATVVSSDLSLGAAKRANVRFQKHGLESWAVVADVEHLPFAARSIDLVAVHDGLHHLDDPFAGLAEMARVAKRWVVVSEPARATVTRLAVRLGLALETEEAGNRVARLEPSEVAEHFVAQGFHVLRAERYAMYYPHHPRRIFRALSHPLIFPIVRFSWRAANRVLGRWGNKMVVVAERPTPPTTAQVVEPG